MIGTIDESVHYRDMGLVGAVGTLKNCDPADRKKTRGGGYH